MLSRLNNTREKYKEVCAKFWSKRGFWTKLILAYIGITAFVGISNFAYNMYSYYLLGDTTGLSCATLDVDWTCSFPSLFVNTLFHSIVTMPILSVAVIFIEPWGPLLDGFTMGLIAYFYVALIATTLGVIINKYYPFLRFFRQVRSSLNSTRTKEGTEGN